MTPADVLDEVMMTYGEWIEMSPDPDGMIITALVNLVIKARRKFFDLENLRGGSQCVVKQ